MKERAAQSQKKFVIQNIPESEHGKNKRYFVYQEIEKMVFMLKIKRFL